MSKVYIVTDGEYSDYHIESCFSTKKKAQEYIDERYEMYCIVKETRLNVLYDLIKADLVEKV